MLNTHTHTHTHLPLRHVLWVVTKRSLVVEHLAERTGRLLRGQIVEAHVELLAVIKVDEGWVRHSQAISTEPLLSVTAEATVLYACCEVKGGG